MDFSQRTPGRTIHKYSQANSDLDQRPPWMVDGMEATLVEGDIDLGVVGEFRYQKNLRRLAGDRNGCEEPVLVDVVAALVTEPNNPDDTNAISIWINGLKVGYLSRDDARRHQPGLLALQDKHSQPIALAGVITGGGIHADGQGLLSVFLRYDPEQFGLGSTL